MHAIKYVVIEECDFRRNSIRNRREKLMSVFSSLIELYDIEYQNETRI